MTSSILFSSELYPLAQKLIITIINIAIIINNKKNAVFDIIFSLDPNTLHEVTFKFEIPFLLLVSSKFSYNLLY